MDQINILLSMAGRKTHMIQYFNDTLNGSGKVFASNSVMTYALTQADGYLITPQTFDDSYMAALTDFCQSNQINYIIPLSDPDLPVLSKNKQKLRNQHISAIVSDEQTVEICNDKWKTYQLLSTLGLPQPKTYIDLELARQDIKSGNLNFPLFIKPRRGTEYMGIIEVDTLDELNVFYPRVQREIVESYLRDRSQQKNIVIQEKIVGDEYSLDILHDLKSNFLASIAKHKQMKSKSTVFSAQIVDNKPFENAVKTISSHLQLVAAIDADCFITKAGEVVVLEINGRCGNQYPFAHLAGINFPEQMIKWFKGQSTSDDYFSYELGVTGCISQLLPKSVNF